MPYRVPTHLDPSLIPPPSAQVYAGATSMASPPPGSPYDPSPWRGIFVAGGMRASDRGSSVEIRVVGVEIDGNCQMPLWPHNIFFSVPAPPVQSPSSPPVSSYAQAQAMRARSQSQPTPFVRLGALQSWISQAQAQQEDVPMVTFMPDKSRDPNANAVNQTNFRSLSRILWERQVAAVAPWTAATDTSPSVSQPSHIAGGILIYPSSNSSAILVGAVFINRPFPDFVTGIPRSPSHTPSGTITEYRQPQHVPVTTSTSPFSSLARSRSPVSSPISMRSTYHQPYAFGGRSQTPNVSPVYTRPHHGDSPIDSGTSQSRSYPQSLSPVSPQEMSLQYSQQTAAQMTGQQPFDYSLSMAGSSTLPSTSMIPLPPMMSPITPNPNWPANKEEDGSSTYPGLPQNYPSSSGSQGQYGQ